jgi:hypothetical protein
MLGVKVDVLKNRLYLTLGRVRKDEVADSAKKIEEEIKKLEHGFTCVTRIIDMRTVDDKDVREIIKIQDMLCEYGVSKVVRVGLEEGKDLLDRVGQDTAYIAVNAENLEDAEELLEQWELKEALKRKTTE